MCQIVEKLEKINNLVKLCATTINNVLKFKIKKKEMNFAKKNIFGVCNFFLKKNFFWIFKRITFLDSLLKNKQKIYHGQNSIFISLKVMVHLPH